MLGYVTTKEMAPTNVVLVGIGIINGLVESVVRVIVIGWKTWDNIWSEILEPTFECHQNNLCHRCQCVII